MDVTDIEAGVDFVDVLQRAVGSCDVLLAVIGPDWATATDRAGRRKLDDPNDFIRLEIGTALKRDVRVIPVLVDDAAMPRSEDLPADLIPLVRRQAVELRDTHWNADVAALSGAIERVMGRDAATPAQPRRWRAGPVVGSLGLLAVVLAAVGVITRDRWMLAPVPSPTTTQTTPSAPSAAVGPTPADPVNRPPPSAPAQPPTELVPTAKGPQVDLKRDALPKPPERSPNVERPKRPDRPPPVPDVVGRSIRDARATLERAGFVIEITWVERKGASDTVLAQAAPRRDTGGEQIVALQVGRIAMAVVYFVGEGKALADDLVEHLQATFGARLRRVLAVNGSRSELKEGEVRYGGTGFAEVAALVSGAASERLAMRLRRPVTLGPATLGARSTPGAVIIFVPSPAPVARDTDTGARHSADPPNVVGQPVATAREALTRAGFAVRQKYTQRNPRAQPPQVPGTVISQERIASPGGQTTSFIVLDVVATATVLVAYARADEQRTAEDLSVSLRGSINDPQYLIRAGTSRNADTARGQVYYSAPELAPLARRAASDTALWIARKFGRKIDVRPVAFDKVSSTYVIVNMPDLEPPR